MHFTLKYEVDIYDSCEDLPNGYRMKQKVMWKTKETGLLVQELHSMLSHSSF